MGNVLHPPVVIEYLGDRDKRITPDAITSRVFRKNPAFDDARVLVESDEAVFKFCEARPQIFRRRTDLEAAQTRRQVIADMAEHVEDYADILYPAFRARLESDGLIKKTKPTLKRAPKKTRAPAKVEPVPASEPSAEEAVAVPRIEGAPLAEASVHIEEG